MMAALSAEPSGSGVHSVVLNPANIFGADLSVPYEVYAIPALKWWLLCRGIKAPSSWKKAQLINRFVWTKVFRQDTELHFHTFSTIYKAVKDKANIVDVDGSCLYRKHKQLADSGLTVSPMPLLSPPLSGWKSVSQDNVELIAKKVPHVTSGE